MQFLKGLLRVRSRVYRRLVNPMTRARPSRAAEVAELIAVGDRQRDERSWAAAATSYARALQLNPELAGIWVQLGHCEKEQRRDSEALAAYERGAKIEGDEAALDALLHLGHLHRRVDGIARAKRTFEELLRRSLSANIGGAPLIEVCAALGELASTEGRWGDAREHYARVLEHAPERHDIWVQLGHAHKEGGDLSRAEFCYRAAIKLDAAVADQWLQLGHVLKLRNRREDAVRAYARAVLLDATRHAAVDALRAASGYSPVEAIARVTESAEDEFEERRAPTRFAQLEAARAAVVGGIEIAARTKRGAQERHVKLRSRAMHPRRPVDGPLSGLTILVFPNIDWFYRRQRPQHLAMRLADRGARVFYVSTVFDAIPGAPGFHLIDEPHPGVFEIRLRGSAGAGSIHDGIDPAAFDVLRRSVAFFVADLALVDSAIVVQHPGWWPVIRELGQGPLFYDCLDDATAFENADPRLGTYERQLVEAADHVTATSQHLRDGLTRADVTILRNGVDWAAFSAEAPTAPIRSARPRIGYFGAIADWFDVSLVTRLAKKRLDWDFVLCGEVTTRLAPLAALGNVELVGEVRYVDLPARLASFDVALIPFKVSPLTRATNPVKLYEYVAGGKPVVATPLPELEQLPDLVAIASDVDEFESAVAGALAEDDSVRIERRIAWARDHDWERRADQLTRVIAAHYPAITVSIDERHLRDVAIVSELDIASGYRGSIRFDIAPANADPSASGFFVDGTNVSNEAPGWARRMVRERLRASRETCS